MYDHKPVKGMQHTEMPDQMTLSTDKDFLNERCHLKNFFSFLIKQNNPCN